MLISFARKFNKAYEKADPKIKKAFKNRLKVFKTNPLHPSLNNHPLKGNYVGLRSINVTGDWRALYKETRIDDELRITFEIIGTHSQLYK